MDRYLVTASLALLITAASCRARQTSTLEASSSDAGSGFKVISMAEWEGAHKKAKVVTEIGCSCEARDGRWSLFRFAEADQQGYKIMIAEAADVAACVKKKFDPHVCRLKY